MSSKFLHIDYYSKFPDFIDEGIDNICISTLCLYLKDDFSYKFLDLPAGLKYLRIRLSKSTGNLVLRDFPPKPFSRLTNIYIEYESNNIEIELNSKNLPRLETFVIEKIREKYDFYGCNFETKNTTFPPSLKNLKLEIKCGEIDLSNLNKLEELTFCQKINTSKVIFPKFLKKLVLLEYYSDFEVGDLPKTLQVLTIEDGFNYTLKNPIFPESLEELNLNGSFNSEIRRKVLPKNLKILRLEGNYNHKLGKYVLPDNLKLLIMRNYTKQFQEHSLPPNLKFLKLNEKKIFKRLENLIQVAPLGLILILDYRYIITQNEEQLKIMKLYKDK